MYVASKSLCPPFLVKARHLGHWVKSILRRLRSCRRHCTVLSGSRPRYKSVIHVMFSEFHRCSSLGPNGLPTSPRVAGPGEDGYMMPGGRPLVPLRTMTHPVGASQWKDLNGWIWAVWMLVLNYWGSQVSRLLSSQRSNQQNCPGSRNVLYCRMWLRTARQFHLLSWMMISEVGFLFRKMVRKWLLRAMLGFYTLLLRAWQWELPAFIQKRMKPDHLRIVYQTILGVRWICTFNVLVRKKLAISDQWRVVHLWGLSRGTENWRRCWYSCLRHSSKSFRMKKMQSRTQTLGIGISLAQKQGAWHSRDVSVSLGSYTILNSELVLIHTYTMISTWGVSWIWICRIQ